MRAASWLRTAKLKSHQNPSGGSRRHEGTDSAPYLLRFGAFFALAPGRSLPREWRRRPVMRRSEGSKNQRTELAEELDTGAISDSNHGSNNYGSQLVSAGGRSGAAAVSLLRRDDAGALRTFRQRAMYERLIKTPLVQPPDAKNRMSGDHRESLDIPLPEFLKKPAAAPGTRRRPWPFRSSFVLV